MGIDRFRVFNHLWAIAGFCEWHRWTWTESGGSAALLVAALALFAFPHSVACLALYATTQILFASLAANSPWNHGLLMAILNAGILLAIARCGLEQFREGSSEWDRERIFETFAPALRVALIVLYLWTGFHKLNADFLDPAVSCAGALMGWMNEVYGFLPLERWAVIAAIAGTLAVELSVPILLCFRRTAYAGLAIGAGFHLFLSQYGGLHGFAAMLFALYFLFLPKAFTARIAERIAALTARFDPIAVRRFTLPAVALAALVVGKALGALFGLDYTRRGLLFWDVWAIAVVLAFGRAFLDLRRIPADFTLRPRWKPLAVIPCVVFLNGAMPYVGLKTETSWAMYSNLRTAYAPNHLLVPGAAKVFALQDDLIAIVDTTLPGFEPWAGEPVALHAIEFRRIAGAAEGDFTVTYRRDGRTGSLAVVDGVSNDASLTTPPRLLGRLLRFRPVDTGPRARCRH